ncbi:MAG: Uma2 family endonuclease [Planctomycetes bacterium]|nr:Uma2 family endonuclease [Planctomycetota bacterium]
MAALLTRRRFTVEDYEKMVRAGVLTEDDRVELIEGEIVEMSPIGERHAACVKRVNRLLTRLLGERAIVSVQDPVCLGNDSEPEPDIAILRPRADFYVSGHPRARDILLIIEVADTTRKKDREVKIPLYARAGVMESWLVDLEARRIEVFRKPSARGYLDRSKVRAGGRISPAAFPDIEIPAGEILV